MVFLKFLPLILSSSFASKHPNRKIVFRIGFSRPAVRRRMAADGVSA
jgi:hypothetical protein